MPKDLMIHFPEEIADWQIKEIVRELKSAVDSFTEFDTGKASIRRDGDAVVKVELKY